MKIGILIAVFVLFALSIAAQKFNITMLHDLQMRLNLNSTRSPGDQMTPASTIFKTGYWSHYTHGIPVLVQDMNYHSDRMGNFIGNYFDDISCAAVSGMHFVGIHLTFVNRLQRRDVFWEGLPTLILHPNPVSFEEATTNVHRFCSCGRYCWDADHPWMTQLTTIRQIMQHGLYLHLDIKDQYGRPLHYQPLHYQHGIDMASPDVDANDHNLPQIPDVAIHYRCSDNLYGGMGLMSFGMLIERIPPNSKFIYILTEYGGRLSGTPLEVASHHILRRLLTELRNYFPTSQVVIRRGGNEFTAWAQLLLANVTICSPSTFCLWPAVGRTQTTYMPATNYIAYSRSDSTNDHGFIHETFHWINDPHLYNNFTKETKVGDIIDTLIWDLPPLKT